MSIFCGNCGAELPDDAQFCTNCGHSVPAKSAESEGTETVNAAVETDAAAEPTAAAPASPTDSASQPAAAPSSAETAAAPSSAETAPVQNNKNLIPHFISFYSNNHMIRFTKHSMNCINQLRFLLSFIVNFLYLTFIFFLYRKQLIFIKCR